MLTPIIKTTKPNPIQPIPITKLSNKPKAYICIPQLSTSCRSDFIHFLLSKFSPDQKLITTDFWSDQSMIPEDLRTRITWFAKKTQFHNFPQDNFIITHNIGYIDNIHQTQLMIFVDQEYLPIIYEAIEVAKAMYEEQKHRISMPPIEVLTCDPTSNYVEQNPIRHYYYDFGVEFPDIQWFL